MMQSEHDKSLFDVPCRILSTEQISSQGFIHEYESPSIAEKSYPGQFVQIRTNTVHAPLLRRPFSVLGTDLRRGSFSILFKVFGEGTKLLASRKSGDVVDILGPLGNCFEAGAYKDIFLVGGGIGIPPIYFLLSKLNLTNQNIRLYFGARTKEELWLISEIDKKNVPSMYTTDDGSFGDKGLVTIPLENDIKQYAGRSDAVIAACGPMPMLSEVRKLSLKYSVPAQLSVETMMACGFGICMGCVLPNNKDFGYSLVCKDGPVFNENEIDI